MPQAPDLEQVVLGALMLEAACFSEVADLLKPEAFYVEGHQILYRLIQHMHEHGDAVDILTVTNLAKSRGVLETVGGPFYISQLTNRVSSTFHLREHSLIILQKFIAREQIRIGSELIKRGYDESFDVFDNNAEALMEISRLNEWGQAEARSAAEISKEVVDTTEPDRAVPTYFPHLDEFIRLEPGTVTIVGARPGMGKTAFAISLAWRHVKMGGTAYFASMEMRDRGLVNRLICGECGVPVWLAKRRKLSDAQTETMANFAITENKPLLRLLVDEAPCLDTQALQSRVDRAKRKQMASLVIVDYLQLMTVRGEKFKDRYHRVTAVSEQLRIVAKQSGIPWVVISQLNRGDRGAVRRPSMNDLRESGQIEQDAEGILLLHRPKYYDPQADDTLEVIVAKNRDGKDGIANLWFDGDGIRVVDQTTTHETTSTSYADAPF